MAVEINYKKHKIWHDPVNHKTVECIKQGEGIDFPNPVLIRLNRLCMYQKHNGMHRCLVMRFL